MNHHLFTLGDRALRSTVDNDPCHELLYQRCAVFLIAEHRALLKVINVKVRREFQPDVQDLACVRRRSPIALKLNTSNLSRHALRHQHHGVFLLNDSSFDFCLDAVTNHQTFIP